MNTSVTELKERLSYNPLTGVFLWIKSPHHNTPVGSIAGAISSSGHRQIKLNGRPYMAHRLAWLYMTGEWPVHQIDHINRNPDDNRFCNLREATMAQNMQNRAGWAKSGHRGVYWQAAAQKWQAFIRVNGRGKSLGYYREKSDAIDARIAAEAHYFGEFAASKSAAIGVA